MVNVTVTFDPTNAAEIEQARLIIDQLASGPTTTEQPEPEAIHQKVVALLRGYGHNRIEYIRAVAKASPSTASFDELVNIVGSAKAIGGTHSSVERAWRAKGMVGPFIQTDLNGNARMDMSLADIVLFALHELDEPDPLVAARY
jgi:hypothetical protein